MAAAAHAQITSASAGQGGNAPELSPAEMDRHLETVARNFMPGPDYLAWLGGIHENLKPKSYLEIGVHKGASLAAAGPHTLSAGVDPSFAIQNSIVSPTRLFKMTSDAFFQVFKSEELFGQKVDFAFLDGLHHFEQTFRDLVNTAKHAHENTVVAVHDMLPVHEIATLRDPVTGFWTGDVWKMIYLVREFFPNLEIWTIPTYPSGLMLLKGFDGTAPEHAVWEQKAFDVMQKPFLPLDAEILALMNVRSTEPEEFFAWLQA